jgi:hypothetical protein
LTLRISHLRWLPAESTINTASQGCGLLFSEADLSTCILVSYYHEFILIKGQPTPPRVPKLGASWQSFQRSRARYMQCCNAALDQAGSRQAEDVAYLEPLNRHRQILPIPSRVPVLSSTTYLAPNATVMGSVYAAPHTYISFGTQIKGLRHAVRIGSNTSIGENCVLDCAEFIPDEAFPHSLNIGTHNQRLRQ